MNVAPGKTPLDGVAIIGMAGRWPGAGNVAELDAFNERVYAELFLTPSSDPWLGLVPADTFTALDNNGVTQVEAGKMR